MTSRAPQIEWRKVRGMRDVLAHAYFGVDVRFIWNTVTTKIDELEAGILSLLDE